MKLSDRQWKIFKLSDIFINFHGKRLTKKDRISGNIPMLTASENMQGVSDFVDSISSQGINIYSDCISIDMFGHAFYHDYKCCGDDNIYFLINDNISKYSKIFITTCINKNNIKYSYGNQFRQNNADMDRIVLPTKNGHIPDYDFMENYIKELMHKKVQNYIKYIKLKFDDIIDINKK